MTGTSESIGYSYAVWDMEVGEILEVFASFGLAVDHASRQSGEIAIERVRLDAYGLPIDDGGEFIAWNCGKPTTSPNRTVALRDLLAELHAAAESTRRLAQQFEGEGEGAYYQGKHEAYSFALKRLDVILTETEA